MHGAHMPLANSILRRDTTKPMKDQLEVKQLEVEELEERIAPSGFGPSNNGNPATRSRTAPSRSLLATLVGMATDSPTKLKTAAGRSTTHLLRPTAVRR